MATHLEIAVAKIAILEQLVRELIKPEFMKASDPLAEAHGYAEHLKQLMTVKADQPATILLTANIDLFFDALVRDMKADLEPPKT
jgi:hypothetical protein